jgi:hypothetical protein
LLNLPLITALKGWHKQWFYCENHKRGLLLEYDTMWIEEPMDNKMPTMTNLASRVSELKGLGLNGIGVVTNWVAHRVIPLKKQVNPRWYYC